MRKKRIYILDIIKIICCFFVFRIHMGIVPSTEFIVSFAVPIFIFITSYNYTRSSYFHDNNTLSKWFTPKHILHKFTRLYLPYLFFALIQLVLISVLKLDYDNINIIFAIFTGGYGPGNYYLLLMIQLIIIFPFLLLFNRKCPNITLLLCFVFYLLYHVVMRLAFPSNPYDVTTTGGIIHKWTIFRWLFLIDFAIYYFIKRNEIKCWQLALLIPIDLIPLILQLNNVSAYLFIRGIPYHFISIAIVGLCIKLFDNISFGKLNGGIKYCGSATWHIFLFQQLYFWLIDALNWQIGFTYLSFPICFLGGLLFYTVQVIIEKY